MLYWLEGDVLSSREDLEKALRDYDAGLYRGRFDAAKIKIDMKEDRKEETRGHPVVRRAVTIDGYDPFTTKPRADDPPRSLPLVLPRREADGGAHPALAPRRSTKTTRSGRSCCRSGTAFSCHATPGGLRGRLQRPRPRPAGRGARNTGRSRTAASPAPPTARSKFNRFIVWRGGTVKNFELRVQVKVTPGGNSGLQYRGTERPDLGESVVTGYQCDVVAKRPDYNGMLYEERGRRILAHTGERVIIDAEGQPWVVGEFPLKSFAGRRLARLPRPRRRATISGTGSTATPRSTSSTSTRRAASSKACSPCRCTSARR